MAQPTTKTKATCVQCGAPIRAKDRFCPKCGTPVAAQIATPAAAPPTSASLQVATASADALLEQRKVVTIVFADLSGSTPLAEKLDPEELRTILGSYFGALARQIQRYEGTIDKYIGDAVMAVFGAPISHEDDAERAIHAALAMQASIVRLNDDLDRKYGVRLALRIGVNTGEVVAGLLAGDIQRAYTVVGDAVNTAQRLESAAPLGEVLASETTRRLAMHRFEFERREPITLKGKSEPVVTYRVVRELDATVEPDATPFVGREAELVRLAEALADVQAGRGRVLSIVGEAGVGKSRLLAEFRRGLPHDMDRQSARCASYEQSTPYALIADFIRGAFGIHAADDEAAARTALDQSLRQYGQGTDPTVLAVVLEIIGYPVRSTLDPERKRSLLVGFVRSILQRAGAHGPFLLAAEDLHWVDDASVGVLAELVGETATLPCLFVTSSRPSWRPTWEADAIELAPLDELRSRALIEAMLGLPVDRAAADRVLERTSGNPFFIEEVVRELQTAGYLIEREGRILRDERVAERLPATIQEVVEARLDRLPDPAKHVVRPAAVIGRTFWYRVLLGLVPASTLTDGIGTLEQEAIVAPRATLPELTYAFRQALIRDVAYQVQLQSVRRRTHAEVAATIEGLFADRIEEFVDLLAYHYERGDDPAKALEWVLRAGDRAKGLFANTEALAMYGTALGLAADGGGPRDASAIHERIGDVQLLVGRYDDAIASYAAAETRAGEAVATRRAALLRKGGNAKAMKGDYGGARATFDEALSLAADDGAERSRIQAQIGQLQWRLGEHAAARETLKAAVSAGEKAGADDAVAEGLKQLGNVTLLSGDRNDATTYYRLSLAMYERLGDTAGLANVHSNLGVTNRRMGQWLEALGEFEQSLALRELMGDPWGIGTIHNNIGEVHRTRGEPQEAIAAYERALAVWSRIGYASGVALALTGLGAAFAESGDVERGIATLRDAEAKWAAVGSTAYLADLYQFLAAAELSRGDLDAAQAAAERSRGLAAEGGSAHMVAVADRILGEILVARGDRSRGLVQIRLSRDALAELDEVPELLRADAVLARLGA